MCKILPPKQFQRDTAMVRCSLCSVAALNMGWAELGWCWAGAVTDFKLILQHLDLTYTRVNGAFDPHCSEYTQYTHFL